MLLVIPAIKLNTDPPAKVKESVTSQLTNQIAGTQNFYSVIVDSCTLSSSYMLPVAMNVTRITTRTMELCYLACTFSASPPVQPFHGAVRTDLQLYEE